MNILSGYRSLMKKIHDMPNRRFMRIGLPIAIATTLTASILMYNRLMTPDASASKPKVQSIKPIIGEDTSGYFSPFPGELLQENSSVEPSSESPGNYRISQKDAKRLDRFIIRIIKQVETRHNVVGSSYRHSQESNLDSDLIPETRNIPENSLEGKIFRAMSFDRQIGSVALKNGLPKSMIYGLGIRESGFDQKAVNPDGGVGVLQLMVPTALEMGIKNVFGNVFEVGPDYAHGSLMKGLVIRCGNDLKLLVKYDDRFDLVKSLEAGAAYLRKMKDRAMQLYPNRSDFEYNNMALLAYNMGPSVLENPKLALNALSIRHVWMARYYQWHSLKALRDNNLSYDHEELATLDGIFGLNYSMRKKRGNEVIDEYTVVVNPGDTPLSIAAGFNALMKHKKLYFRVSPENIELSSSSFAPGVKAYIPAVVKPTKAHGKTYNNKVARRQK